MSKSPTQLSLDYMRERGYHAAVTEKWNPHAKVRQDLFGVIDVLCVGFSEVIAIQATSDNGGNVSARVHKIADAEATPALRKCNWKIVVHGWKKKRGRWTLREVDCS